MAQTLKRMYEGMFLVDSATAAADWDVVVETIQNVFNRAQADVVSLRRWDERRLCFDIKGHKRGTYILTYFHADSERIGGIERDVQLDETLLRVLILRADEISAEKREEPTPAMLAEQQGSSPDRNEHDDRDRRDADDRFSRHAGPRRPGRAEHSHDETRSPGPAPEQGATPDQGPTPAQGATPDEQVGTSEQGATPDQGPTPEQGATPDEGSTPDQGQTPEKAPE